MSNKIILILILSALAVAGLIIGAFFLFGGKSNNDKTQVNKMEDTRIREFSKVYFELYNSYGFEYYSNMSSLGGESMDEMQNKLSARFLELQDNTPEGFNQEASTNLQDWSMEFNDKEGTPWARVSFMGTVSSYDSVNAKPVKSNYFVKMIMYKINNQWKVFSFEQYKK